jgi:hypothetical protein
MEFDGNEYNKQFFREGIMETWFKYNRFAHGKEKRISSVLVDKATNQTIWINGRANRIRSDYHNFFPTFQEAKNFAINRYAQRIEVYKSNIEDAEKEMAIIQAEEEL